MNEYWDIFLQNDDLLRSSLERVEIKYLICLQVDLGLYSKEYMVEKYNLHSLSILDEWMTNLLPYDCCNTYSNGDMSCIDDIGMQKVMEEIKNNNADGIANVMATQVKYTNDRNTLKMLLNTLHR